MIGHNVELLSVGARTDMGSWVCRAYRKGWRLGSVRLTRLRPPGLKPHATSMTPLRLRQPAA